MLWQVPRMWEDGECWIIGGGPSIPKQFGVPTQVIDRVLSGELKPEAYSSYMQPIHSKHCIGINAAYMIGSWMDIIFFGDRRFFLQHMHELAAYPGIKCTCNPKFEASRYRWVKYLQRDRNHPRGISAHNHRVSWNNNSGAAAISVAVHAGVKRVVLLGFDMDLDKDNRQHWHSAYRPVGKKRNARKLPFHRHLLGFEAIARDARRMKVEIINASPTSKITQFPKVNVKDLL